MINAADFEWLGLAPNGSGGWSFELTPGIARFDGKFYGGTGIAVATAVMEAATGRRAVWATVQFASTTTVGRTVDCSVTVTAGGRRTSQLHVVGSVGGEPIFLALGATGDDRPGPLNTQFGCPRDVPGPLDCDPWRPIVPMPVPERRPGWLGLADIRQTGKPGAMWMRMDGQPLSRPALGFLADIVPSGVVGSAGRAGAGTSLDNSIRFGPDPDTEWVLVDVDPYLISGGYVHGAARLWSTEGVLLGVASQTASLLLFD